MDKRYIVNPQVINYRFNELTDTPLGKGRSFGRFELKVKGQESLNDLMIVRLPLNDVTREHLKDSNCLTPNAKKSALFTFPFSEAGQGWAEWLIIAALLVLVVIFAGDVLGWAW